MRRPVFGAEMRRLLAEQGMTYRALAARAYHGKSYLSAGVSDDELDAVELARRVEASDVSPKTPTRLEAAVDDLATPTRRFRHKSCCPGYAGTWPTWGGSSRTDDAGAAPPAAHIQATAQEGRAWARMRQRTQTRAALDRVDRLVASLPVPDRPEHHYQYDPDKALSYAATTLAWAGDPGRGGVRPYRHRPPQRAQRSAGPAPAGGLGPARPRAPAK